MIQKKKSFYLGLGFLAVFLLWTISVRLIDVQAIGPQSSCVGFATLNGYVHALVGTNMALYTLTDWLGIVPIGFAIGFALLGLTQWIQRKSWKRVDFDVLALGGFYIAVMAVYLLFEMVVVNYRPVLIDGYLEVSYPSSTTMLVTCVMPTAMLQFRARIQNKPLRQAVLFSIALFTAFMVIGRFISGVHWCTDILGGVWISTGLVLLYHSIARLKTQS